MRKGFTIIEMLVVILIIGLMIGMSIPYINSRKWSLPTVEETIKGKIRLARQLSISKEQHYGIFFRDNDKCIVFVDNNDNGTADNGEEVDVFDLPNGIFVSGESSLGTSVSNTNPIIFNAKGMTDFSYEVFVTNNEDTAKIYVGVSGFIQ